MGRLEKAFSEGESGSGELRDEAAYLQTAGEALARIQQELRNHEEPGGSVPRQSSGDDGASDYQSPMEFPQQRAAGTSSHPRESVARPDDANQLGATRRSAEHTEDNAGLNGLKLFVGPDDELPHQAESADEDREADVVQKKVVDEFIQEQHRWTERHAMQGRSIEERIRQLASVHAEVEMRERELDRREHELDVRTRELSSKAESEVRTRISRDWESTQQELSRLTEQVRRHADRASQYEAELAEVRREHAIELDALRGQLSQQDNSRVERARSVIDECEQRMAELTAQRAAFQTEQTRRREELARERLQQRDELRQQQQAFDAERQAAQEAFEHERDTTIARLERERREWNTKFNREQDELLDLKRTVENEVEEMRAALSREKAEWVSHQEQVRVAQRKESTAVEAGRAEVERLRHEHENRFTRLKQEFDSEREQWHRQRGQEAAILQSERSEIETEADRLRAERSQIETQRQRLAVELEQQRAEHDEKLRQSWREHQESIQLAEQESANRQRVLAENLRQRENELSARMKQAEHEIRSARELCSRQIAQEKERFTQTFETQEAELERQRAELNAQRQQFEREKREFADASQRTLQKNERERAAIRETLSQMDVQLRSVAASLLHGTPSTVTESTLAESLNSLADVAGIATESEVASEAAESDRLKDNRDDSRQSAPEGEETPDTEVAVSAASDADVWEPGRDATLVDSISDDLIYRVDPAAEQGGVSGLEQRPAIAQYGALADAAADASRAEIVYDDRGRQAEWAATVATRSEQAKEQRTEVSADAEGRRQALESYRSKLSSLQDQLRQLSKPSVGGSESEQSARGDD